MMAAFIISCVIFTIVVAISLLPVVYSSSTSFPATLTLERTIPIGNHTTPNNVSHLTHRDRVRHGRMLYTGVIGYGLGGNSDLSLGLYYTRVEIGTPPQNFYLQVDTGSDITWVGCVNCDDCPLLTRIPSVSLHLYNPASSASYSSIGCSDVRCPTGVQGSSCSATNNFCNYSSNYRDVSQVWGFYFQDLLNYEVITPDSKILKSTAPLIFGCSTKEPGFRTNSQVDGILGLGKQSISVISQLAKQGVTPYAFSHCLDGQGGGILVLGEIIGSNIVYTPLLPSRTQYSLEMEAVSVNGQLLAIDDPSTAFSSPGNQGIIIDSGTTLAYLPSQPYDKLMEAVTVVLVSAPNLVTNQDGDLYCYLTTTSVNGLFPRITLTFKGGANLILAPQDYLLNQGFVDGTPKWCTGFQKNDNVDAPTILGDVVMKNKFFIYDLVGQRIGWTDYNYRSAAVNVSTGLYIPPTLRPRPKRSGSSITYVPITSFTLLLIFLVLLLV